MANYIGDDNGDVRDSAQSSTTVYDDRIANIITSDVKLPQQMLGEALPRAGGYPGMNGGLNG